VGLRKTAAFDPTSRAGPPSLQMAEEWQTTFGSLVAVVRKTPWIRRPGKLAAKRP